MDPSEVRDNAGATPTTRSSVDTAHGTARRTLGASGTDGAGARAYDPAMADVCPLCWNHASASPLLPSSGSHRFGRQIQCTTCGTFVAGQKFDLFKESFDRDKRYLLQGITRAATEAGTPPVEMSVERAQELIATTPWPSSDEQDALFLAYIARNAKQRRDPVAVNSKTDYPLFFAKGEKEVRAIARELMTSGFIQRTDTSAVPRYRLTREGRAELQRLRPNQPATAPAAPAVPMSAPSQAPVTPHATTPNHHTIPPTEKLVENEGKGFDLFLAHASEDKAVARDLYSRFASLGLHVFFDEVSLTVGDSLTERIDAEIHKCGHGVVLLSPSFLAKHKQWTKKELRSLLAKQTRTGKKCLLPVWHNVSSDDVATYSEDLADKVAANTRDGLDRVVEMILQALGGPTPTETLPPPLAPPGPISPVPLVPPAPTVTHSRSLSTLTPGEAEEMRRLALRGGRPTCPEDDGILELTDATHFGSKGREFIAFCPICGKTATLSPP